ncbi:MAG: glycosyltransferase [Cyanosarcina radialis HA8281-LM2]|jgi:glycosyltransferase involved in cell wall biosynthesis|nr:glycosyltransferase [Cyanosarcina radialis HA8281-LM2]
MPVSVIIPVYNAENYLRQAVESALSQPETGEVLLIEDASPDNSLDLCQQLVAEYRSVKLLRHQNGRNEGASASRNLGIKTASCEYIAFLDADDFYLPGRFATAVEKFKQHPEIDGVYEAIGTYFQDEDSREKWNSVGRGDRLLTTISENIEPELLFATMVLKKEVGWFHCNGLVVKKNIFDRTGYFDRHLEFSEDVVMWFKMAAVGRLLPGRLDAPVAMRRVHSYNHITRFHKKLVYYSGLPRWKTLFAWGYNNGLESEKLALLFIEYVNSIKNSKSVNRMNFVKRQAFIFFNTTSLIVKFPKILQLEGAGKILSSLYLRG